MRFFKKKIKFISTIFNLKTIFTDGHYILRAKVAETLKIYLTSGPLKNIFSTIFEVHLGITSFQISTTEN